MVLVGFVAFLVGWAVASPVASTPDEDFHLASIWCAQGERHNACQLIGDPSGYGIPTALYEAPCFAFDETQSAACQPTNMVSTDISAFSWTGRGNFGQFSGDYPPLFYSTMSLFVGPDIVLSVIVMRVFNVLLLTTMLAAIFTLSAVVVRRAMVVTTAVTIVPLGAFLIPSVNPSSWATISAMTLFFAMYGYLTSCSKPRMIALGVLSAVSLVIGAGARADASMYSVLAVCAAVAVGVRGRQTIRTLSLRLILPLALVVIAAVSFLSAGQSGAAGQGRGGSPLAFIYGIWDILRFWVGAFGMTPLGWLDTPLPSIVWVLVTFGYAAVCFVALAQVSMRRGLVVTAIALSAVLIPAYVEATSANPEGSVQSRYIYPMLILLMAVSALVFEKNGLNITVVQRWLLVGAQSTAAAVALYENLRRYTSGGDGPALLSSGDWWWPGAWVPAEVVLVVAAVGYLAAFSVLSRILIEREIVGRRLLDVSVVDAR